MVINVHTETETVYLLNTKLMRNLRSSGFPTEPFGTAASGFPTEPFGTAASGFPTEPFGTAASGFPAEPFGTAASVPVERQRFTNTIIIICLHECDIHHDF